MGRGEGGISGIKKLFLNELQKALSRCIFHLIQENSKEVLNTAVC